MPNHKDVTFIRRMKPYLWPIITIIFIIWCWWWPTPITTVYISRHAEKLNATANTPLSASGQIRATKLAHVLEDEGIDALFVTQFLRTQQTGEPTATQAGISVIQYNTPQDVVDTILANHAGNKILVIAHSNTVDDIATGLGVSGVSELAESQFDRLFVVHRFGSTAHLDQLRYGEETP